MEKEPQATTKDLCANIAKPPALPAMPEHLLNGMDAQDRRDKLPPHCEVSGPSVELSASHRSGSEPRELSVLESPAWSEAARGGRRGGLLCRESLTASSLPDISRAFVLFPSLERVRGVPERMDGPLLGWKRWTAEFF